MLRINLLPVRKIKQKAAAEKELKTFGLALCILLAVLIAWAWMLINTVSGLKEDIADLEKRKQELAKILEEIKKLEEQKAEIERKTGVVDKLAKSRGLTVRVLDAIARNTPNERLWLTSFDQSGGTMNINGVALDNQTVAEYLDRLRGKDAEGKQQAGPQYITGVSLTSASLQQHAGRNLKNFVITGSVAMPTLPEEQKNEPSKEPPK
jgi:type IV pilus assembly protein PilN